VCVGSDYITMRRVTACVRDLLVFRSVDMMMCSIIVLVPER
jgi:hypothetical protein